MDVSITVWPLKATSGLVGFFKMADAANLDFPTFRDRKGQEGQYASVTVPNFVAIGQTAAEIRRFFYFFKMAAVRQFVMREFRAPRWALGGLYHTVQRLVRIDNMQVLISYQLGLKTPKDFGDL